MNVFQCNVFQQNVFQNNCAPSGGGGGGHRRQTLAQLQRMLNDNAQAQTALADEEALLLLFLEDET